MSRGLALFFSCVLVDALCGQPAPRPDPFALPHGAVVRLGAQRFHHDSPLHHLAFFPGDRQLFGAWGEVVGVWDTKDGRQVKRLLANTPMPRVALSPDGKTVAAAGKGFQVFLFDAATGLERGRLRLEGATSPATALAWSADGRTLASGAGAKVMLWNVDGDKPPRPLQSDSPSCTALVFAPDGKMLAGGDSQSLQIFDLTTGRIAHKLDGQLQDGTTSLVFTPDGKTLAAPCYALASGVGRASLRQWDAASGKKIRDLDYGTFHSAAFSPNGKLLASGDSKSIRIWDRHTGRELRQWYAHASRVTSLTFSGDGHTLASAGWDRHVRLWDPTTGKERSPTQGHIGPVQAVAFSPDGSVIASGGLDRTLRLWDWVTGQELHHWDGVGGDWGVVSLAYLRDGKTLVTAETHVADTVFRRWQAGNAAELSRHATGAHASVIAFAPDDSLIAANGDGNLAHWQIGPWLKRPSVGHRTVRLGALNVSRAGHKVAWSGAQGDLGIRDLASGKDLIWPNYPGTAAAFSPDAALIATTAPNQPLRLWDASSAKMLFEWDKVWGEQVTFSSDGRLLAVNNGLNLEIFEVASRLDVHHFSAKFGKLTALAFAPHGRALVSAWDDGTMLVWDVTGIAKNGKLPQRDLAAAELTDQWQQLLGTSAPHAQTAIWTLAAVPERALPLIEKLLSPAPILTDKIASLIAGLGNESFPVRNQASRDLAALGAAADVPLRRALASAPSLEVRRRLETLLSRIDQQNFADAAVQTQRAVAVLEYAATAQTTRFLERLAAGDPDARLTIDAHAALKRLKK